MVFISLLSMLTSCGSLPSTETRAFGTWAGYADVQPLRCIDRFGDGFTMKRVIDDVWVEQTPTPHQSEPHQYTPISSYFPVSSSSSSSSSSCFSASSSSSLLRKRKEPDSRNPAEDSLKQKPKIDGWASSSLSSSSGSLTPPPNRIHALQGSPSHPFEESGQKATLGWLAIRYLGLYIYKRSNR